MTDLVKEEPNYQESFTPMPTPSAPAPEAETFSSNVDGLSQAANELNSHRELEEPPLVREYQNLAGEHKGERRPLNETVDIHRAAQDLADARRAERDAQEVLAAHALQKEIDAERQSLEALPPVEPQPEAQPQAPNGLDPEIAKALENPKIRDAIAQQVQASETARQQYMAAIQQVGQAATANILANFPELQGVTQQAFPQVLQAINARDPARAQAIVNHIRTAGQHMQAVQQQAVAAQQHAAQQQQTWMNQQDDVFENWAKSQPAAEVKQVRAAAIDTLVKEYGIDRNELAQLWSSSPLLRSAPVQRLLYDVTRYQLARQSIQKAPMPNRPVMRPGDVSAPGYDYSGVAEKMREFAGNPTPKNAAAALMARRRAAANQR
jgi:hypothetical protein